MGSMPPARVPRPPRPVRRRPDRYHHGDLRRALILEALRTIQKDGAAALTLRGVGESLGVSRTALYRHFADKQALLNEVADEGFRLLATALREAWGSGGRRGFDAMGLAYVGFAVAHPSHYRVMFGGAVRPAKRRDDPNDPGTNAFQVLVDAIVEQQRAGLIRHDAPLQLARFIWAVVHGVAMLALDGILSAAEAGTLARFANERLRTGLVPE
jgi:AcrR family transcriptional regulator